MTFKEVWRKAIEKYSPKKAEKLNEVSFRFQQKLEEIAKTGKTKGQIETENDQDNGLQVNIKPRVPGLDEEEERIKFVSMIDQKPIKPSYLELVPMKDFTRKEQKANK